jgi:hypothetical protein
VLISELLEYHFKLEKKTMEKTIKDMISSLFALANDMGCDVLVGIKLPQDGQVNPMIRQTLNG